jgi:hypothetical protein
MLNAAVVSHKDPAAHAGTLDAKPCLLDAASERIRLVQAGHHNGQIDCVIHP